MSNSDVKNCAGKQYNVGIIGATGMVGQRFITLLDEHPWFNLKACRVAAKRRKEIFRGYRKSLVNDRSHSE